MVTTASRQFTTFSPPTIDEPQLLDDALRAELPFGIATIMHDRARAIGTRPLELLTTTGKRLAAPFALRERLSAASAEVVIA
jgi:hypothetical protein